MAQLLNTISKAELMKKVEQQQRKIEQQQRKFENLQKRFQRMENEFRQLKAELKQKDKQNAELTETIEKLVSIVAILGLLRKEFQIFVQNTAQKF